MPTQDKGLSLPLPGTASPAPVDEAEKTELEEQLQDFHRMRCMRQLRRPGSGCHNLRQPAMTVQPPGPPCTDTASPGAQKQTEGEVGRVLRGTEVDVSNRSKTVEVGPL